jgi:hypothetical protein
MSKPDCVVCSSAPAHSGLLCKGCCAFTCDCGGTGLPIARVCDGRLDCEDCFTAHQDACSDCAPKPCQAPYCERVVHPESFSPAQREAMAGLCTTCALATSDAA